MEPAVYAAEIVELFTNGLTEKDKPGGVALVQVIGKGGIVLYPSWAFIVLLLAKLVVRHTMGSCGGRGVIHRFCCSKVGLVLKPASCSRVSSPALLFLCIEEFFLEDNLGGASGD